MKIRIPSALHKRYTDFMIDSSFDECYLQGKDDDWDTVFLFGDKTVIVSIANTKTLAIERHNKILDLIEEKCNNNSNELK